MKQALIIIAGFIIFIGCKKESNENPITTVADKDGNVYYTVVIGKQVWMVENLKTTKYNDGTAIPLITDSIAWANLTTPGYCWYANDTTYKNIYGALYNWYAVNTGKLAPSGWHVPSDAEWITLTTYLGGEGVAGGKMKEAGTARWSSPNIGADNSSGFSALPGGWRDYGSGTFIGIRGDVNWWSSKEYDAASAWGRTIYYGLAIIDRLIYDKVNGFSVRCVRD